MSPPSERLVHALADRYRIERELGAGGMATVYLAADLKHDRKVAVKVLKPELAAVLGAERFVQEIKTTAALSHPHILPLFDSGTAEGFLYYVMPYIKGETIREKLNRETQFGVEEAVRIAREVADALDYAHRNGVIHRDVKPENILLHDGRAMVMDFGIALAVSAAAGGRMTETGLSLGTPHYMSPEQATAEKEITGRSDVYSLASVLYEMLAGQPPHVGGAAQQIIMKIITEPVASVSNLRKSVPAHVAAALAHALEKLPADRFENAKAFGDALANPAFSTAAVGGPAQVATNASALRGAPFLVAASVALLAAIAAVWGWRRAEPPREVNRLSLFLPDSLALTDIRLANRVAISPDGRTIVYAGPGATSGVTQLWARMLDQLRPTIIPGTEGGMNPAFSPDGKHIAFVATTGRRAAKRVPLAGGPAMTLTDSLVDLGGVTWATDGYIYYDGHLEGDGIARVPEGGGHPEIVTQRDAAAGEIYHFQPSALPRGRGILFTITRQSGVNSRDIGVLDSRTGKYKVLTRGIRATYASSGHLLYVTDAGALMATPFDLATLTLVGDAVAVAGSVSVRGNAQADLSISDGGTTVYAAGTAMSTRRELVWVSRDGAGTSVDSTWVGEMSGRPALSPDGRTVAILMGGSSGLRPLWVKQLDRGPASRVADQATQPTWSPDGKWLVYSQGQNGLWRVPSDGSALPHQILSAQQTAGVSSRPTVSQDGSWIVFVKDGNLFGVGTDGDSTPRLLVDDEGTQEFPTISPDGKWLAYQSDESGMAQVYVRPFPEARIAKRPVSVTSGMYPRWTGDGRELIYLDPLASELVSLPVNPGTAFATGLPRQLFSTEPYLPMLGNPFEVSPDGRRFLFTRAIVSAALRPDELVLVQNFTSELNAKVRR